MLTRSNLRSRYTAGLERHCRLISKSLELPKLYWSYGWETRSYSKPPGTGKDFFIYKKDFSIILIAVVDADYKFIFVDIGANGAAADAQIWNTWELNFGLTEDPYSSTTRPITI